MRTSRGPRRCGLLTGLVVASLAGVACTREQQRDPFTASGALIVVSGGDGGAANACFTCHGLRGEGNGAAAPRLAGLSAGYLQRQLRDYALGLRPDRTMAPIAKALDAEDQRAVAAYYAGLPPPPAPGLRTAGLLGRALYHGGDPSRGLAPCAACHGVSGEGMGPANPPLAGQPPAYLAEQLRRWSLGVRRNDPLQQMQAVSRRLSSREIAAVAEYAAAPSPASAPAATAPAAFR